MSCRGAAVGTVHCALTDCHLAWCSVGVVGEQGAEREEVTADWRKLRNEELQGFTANRILLGWSHRGGWDGQCMWHVSGRRETDTGFWWGKLKEGDQLGDVSLQEMGKAEGRRPVGRCEPTRDVSLQEMWAYKRCEPTRDVSLQEMIILKGMLKKQDVRPSIGLIWLRMGISGRLLWTR